MTAPDLRALVEAAKGAGEWMAPASVLGAENYHAQRRYRSAASPDVILALLDEIDALRDVAETALQDTLTVMADDMRLRDADVILQRNTGSGRVA